ncbi:DUF6907 domain-containing protein [Nocardioides sp. J54]|uniref:DUF6907 domain-containing protein n=1 Tax=Nocardioides sp. J54 TaxID=935866 RepID=UPI00048E545B|nr:hypothetical protein [Nocardioides sp. J54]
MSARTRVPVTPCPSWCDRSHETAAAAGDFVHTTAEFIFEGQPGGGEIVYVLAEHSSDNGDGPGYVSINGVKLTPAAARRLAIQLLELAQVAEDV